MRAETRHAAAKPYSKRTPEQRRAVEMWREGHSHGGPPGTGACDGCGDVGELCSDGYCSAACCRYEDCPLHGEERRRTIDFSGFDDGEILGRLPACKGPACLQREAAERFAEERRAWDTYFVAAWPGNRDHGAVLEADEMLDMRRKRFSPPGEEVSVQRSLLRAVVDVGATEGQVGLRQLLEQLAETLK